MWTQLMYTLIDCIPERFGKSLSQRQFRFLCLNLLCSYNLLLKKYFACFIFTIELSGENFLMEKMSCSKVHCTLTLEQGELYIHCEAKKTDMYACTYSYWMKAGIKVECLVRREKCKSLSSLKLHEEVVSCIIVSVGDDSFPSYPQIYLIKE